MIGLFDTHQHLVHPEIAGYGWTSGIPALAGRRFTLADYAALTAGLGIEGTLFMETAVDDGDIRTEARHVAALARDPASGIRGLIVSARPETDAGFAAWLDEARQLGAVGVRRILHVVDDGVSQSETFRANVRRIGAAGLTFDMCFLARQLPLARDLALACPDTTLVVDHCGVPDIAGGALDPWRAGMAALAELPNVFCKLSGLPAYCAPGQATEAAIAPYVAHALDCFGPARMLWGSDWPVVNLGNGLPDWIALTRRILAGLGEDEARAIAGETARRLYRLAPGADGTG
jgi:predicted TIM-barrel fold metal-dependent hydrolase